MSKRSPLTPQGKRARPRRDGKVHASLAGSQRDSDRALSSDSTLPLNESGVRRAASYGLLAIDLDGTLLDQYGVPHAVDVKAIKNLQALGVPVTIITGRLFFGTQKIAEALGITGPVGCADGSHILHAEEGTTLFHHGVEGPSADLVKEVLETRALTTFVFAQNTIHHDARGQALVPFIELWSTDVRSCERVYELIGNGATTSIVAVGEEALIRSATQEIGATSNPPLFTAMFPLKHKALPVKDQWGLIVRAAGPTKATALSWLAEHHGVPMAGTVVVGDWHNDLPMLTAAGRSFAMGQAPALVKEAATDVLEETSATGGGIARAIELTFGARSGVRARKR
jgi:HAD superfamily hydrolase (TIGR01484 family)